jgi:putative acetyltransferase
LRYRRGRAVDKKRCVKTSSSSTQLSKAITIAQAELTSDVSRALIAALNAELEAIYPEPGATHFGLAPEEVSGTRGAFLIIYEDGTPVGCGAVRLLDGETGELKRMYVTPEARGRGLGKRLVTALETSARALGARRLVLETGIRQHAAIKCYRACGFETIPLYGEYLLSPNTSLCLGKVIAAGNATR